MVDLEVSPYAAEICAEMELFREILHPVVLMGSQHHLQFLGIDLAVLVHHEVRRTGGLEIEAVVGAVSVTQAEEMTEFVSALLLECMTVIVLTDRRNTGVSS